MNQWNTRCLPLICRYPVSIVFWLQCLSWSTDVNQFRSDLFKGQRFADVLWPSITYHIHKHIPVAPISHQEQINSDVFFSFWRWIIIRPPHGSDLTNDLGHDNVAQSAYISSRKFPEHQAKQTHRWREKSCVKRAKTVPDMEKSARFAVVCVGVSLLISCYSVEAWYKQTTGPSYYSVGRASGLLSGIRRSPYVRRSESEETLMESGETVGNNVIPGGSRQISILKSMVSAKKEHTTNATLVRKRFKTWPFRVKRRRYARKVCFPFSSHTGD